MNDEFPGLAAAGMSSVGRFGIGFFSVFMLGDWVRVVTRRYDKGSDQGRVLEFRTGLKSRPILYLAQTGDAPIDGGTRVEICLGAVGIDKQNVSRGSSARTSSENIQGRLNAIVAALAPAADVSIYVNGKIAIEAGDWVRISPKMLCQRIRPFLHGRALEEVVPIAETAMRGLTDQSGAIVGRACIFPTSEYTAQAVVTVGGLSAAPAINMVGIMAGEAVTAARDEASILATDANWSEWATEQARLLREFPLEPEVQAQVAEVVLECGGDPGDLCIVRYGDSWLSRSELLEQLRSLKSFRALFGDLGYEGDDPVSRGDFENYFEMDPDLIRVPTYDGRVKGTKRRRAFDDFDHKRSPHHVAKLFSSIVADAWETYDDEGQELQVVGTVHGVEIERWVSIYTRKDSGT